MQPSTSIRSRAPSHRFSRSIRYRTSYTNRHRVNRSTHNNVIMGLRRGTLKPVEAIPLQEDVRVKTFAAVMLVGCGGGSTPLNPSPAGASAAERTHVRPAYSLLYSFKGGTNDGRDPHA